MKLLSVFILILFICSGLALRRVKRIARGFYAKEGHYPHQVGLKIYIDQQEFPTWCGGSIINHLWILTAAHCIQSAKSVDVIMGATKVSSAIINYSVEKENFILHPNWNPHNLTNDIALIKIPYTQYSAKIQPIKLPLDKSYIGNITVATGWGNTNDNENIILNDLKEAFFTVISNDECILNYPTSLAPTNICVKSLIGSSTCGGDSGGPLVLQNSKILVGVASYVSVAGCTKYYLPVFTRVSSYLDWIKSYTDS